MSIYRHISAERAHGANVSLMCGLLGVSEAGYYAWQTRPPSDRALSDAWLLSKIKQIYAENRQVYGSPRIHAELRMAHGVRVSRKRVERLMRQAEISGLVNRSAAAPRSKSQACGSLTISSSASSARQPRTSCGSQT